MFDVTNEKTLASIDNWHDEFLMKAGISDPENFPFVLIANKIDAEDKRQVSKKKAMQLCNTYPNIKYFETSAKDGTGVAAAFNCLAELALNRRIA